MANHNVVSILVSTSGSKLKRSHLVVYLRDFQNVPSIPCSGEVSVSDPFTPDLDKLKVGSKLVASLLQAVRAWDG